MLGRESRSSEIAPKHASSALASEAAICQPALIDRMWSDLAELF